MVQQEMAKHASIGTTAGRAGADRKTVAGSMGSSTLKKNFGPV